MSSHRQSLPDRESRETEKRDARLAVLVSQLAEKLRHGGAADINAVLRENGDLADELRGLWGLMLVTDCMAASAARPTDHRPVSGADSTCAFTPGPAPAPPSAEHTKKRPSTGWPTFRDYEVLEELGRGGMGIVYRARQRSLDRDVALKTVLPSGTGSSGDLPRFRAEAESAARLNHPSIVPIYEVGEENGQAYFTMKYVAGTNLARRLADHPLGGLEAAALLAPVCRAIHYAHQQGVLHRDLKPSNILIDEEGRPHVSDFGLAKQVEVTHEWTLPGVVVGTPSYMAPEQAAGQRGIVGPLSDVYGLGAILYQMLTGHPPFQAATPVETVLLVLEQEPLPPRLSNPRADRDLEMIALKCLQKPPELRYASAAALAEDLEAYLADEPISARQGRFGQIIARAFRETHHATVLKNWGALWMWHAVVLLVVCLLTSLMQWRRVESPVPYLGLWIVGLGTWAGTFWILRRRSGPVSFVERQIAHIWAASMIVLVLLLLVEMILGLPVLSLSPVLALVGGGVFLAKAGILTGKFYLQAAALFATSIPMAILERLKVPLGVALFGLVSAACFFVPGWTYYRQRKRDKRPGRY